MNYLNREIKRYLTSLLFAAALTGCSGQSAGYPPQVETAKASEAKVAFGRFVPEREDDFAWENDRVAFRVYGPASPAEGPISGVDAWFKRVEYPIIDKWYAQNSEGMSYHDDHGEGYDRYHTGTSRGVGGTALWIEGVPYSAAAFKSYEILQNNGDVVEFELRYEWDTPLGQVAEQKTIRLSLGKNFYEATSRFSLDGEPRKLPVAIGLTTHDEAAAVFQNRDRGRISTWETIDGHEVGTGVVVDAARVESIIHIVNEKVDASGIWLVTSTDGDGEISFQAGFGWTGSGQVATVEQWNEYLDEVGSNPGAELIKD